MEHIIGSDIQFGFRTAVAIGKFDSLHLGHRELILKMLRRGERDNLKTVVFSFYPSPAEVLGYEKYPYILTSSEKKDVLLAPPFTGIDFFVEYPFNRAFSQIPPEDFLTDILCGKINCKLLVMGEGYRFGKNQTGTMDTIKALEDFLDIETVTIPKVLYDGEPISSSRIRGLIASNDFSQAQLLMGRPYFINGHVEMGKRLGRRLGFPTANIKIPNSKFIPGDGVYVTGTLINGKTYPSVSNIGANPTLEETVRKCETYIFDFDEQIYDQYITINFYSFIRGEERFDSIEALKKRIEEDTLTARRWWSGNNI